MPSSKDQADNSPDQKRTSSRRLLPIGCRLSLRSTLMQVSALHRTDPIHHRQQHPDRGAVAACATGVLVVSTGVYPASLIACANSKAFA